MIKCGLRLPAPDNKRFFKKLRTLERVVLEVEGEFVADAGEVLLDFAGAVEGYLHVGQNIFRANALEKVGSGEELRRLIACAAEQERLAGFVETVRELLERVDTRGIERGHIAKAQDDDIFKLSEMRGGLGKFVGGAEEKRAVDAKDGDMRRNVLVLEDMGLAVAEILARDGSDGSGFSDAIDVEESGQRHAHADGNGEVGEHGERKGGQPNRDIRSRQAQDGADFAPLAHVVSHHKENRSESGQGHEAGQGSGAPEER